jgi:peptidyl-prolyl cis-trans isomerase SurA
MKIIPSALCRPSLILAVLLLAGPGRAQIETVDKIAAVVGDDVILASELANQVQLTVFQSGRRPTSEEEVRTLQQQILDQMITDKLFLMEAESDTTVQLRPNEVKQALEEHIAGVVANFGSEAEFLAALSEEGMTLRDLERQYESEIRNNLLRQRYIQQKLYGVSVSRYEVEKFYEEFADSIPLQPEGVKLAHILLTVEPSKELEDSVEAAANELRQRVLDGADFATLSVQYSSLGAGANGGDLGYIERSDVVPEFARAAFKLKVGEISGVIRTQFGFHVIKCEGERGSRLHLRHILLAVQPSAADTARTMVLADSLIQEIRGGADFAEVAKAYSRDDDSRVQGGELGWFALSQLPDAFSTAVANWYEPGEVRGPIVSRFGIHILKLLDYQAEKKLDLATDYDRIKALARQDKTGRTVDKWIEEIKARTYIEYRLEGFGG